MTISSEIRTAGPFSGNGVTSSFPFDFKVFRPEDLYVVVAPEDGEGETPLVLGTDYSVTLNPDQNAVPGGTIVTTVPLAVGFSLTATSALDFLQPVDLTNQGGFYPSVINDGLDRLTIFAQQLGEGLGRALKVPLSDGPITTQLPGKAARAGAVLAFHEETGEPIAGPSIAQVGTVAGALSNIATVSDNIDDVNTVAQNINDVNTVAQNIADVNTVADNIADVNTVADNIADVTNFADVYYGPSPIDPTTRRDGSPLQPGDLYYNVTGGMRVYTELGTWTELPLSANMANVTFSGDGVTTDFQLPYAPGTKANMWVFISGVYQQKETFDVEGDVLKFASPPPAGADNIEVVLLAVTQSDATLRQELASPSGAAMVALAGGGDVQGFVNLAVPTFNEAGGASGEGVTNDAPALKTAIESGASSLRSAPGKTYRIMTSVTAMVDRDLEIDLRGCELAYDGGSITIRNTPRMETSMLAAAAGDQVITLTDAGTQVGDLLFIRTGEVVSADHGNYYKMMVRRVLGVSGNQVTVCSPLRFPIALGENGLSVTVYPPRKVSIIGGRLTGLHSGNGMIVLRGFVGGAVSNTSLVGPIGFEPRTDYSRRGISLRECYGYNLSDIYVERMSYPVAPVQATKATTITGITGVDCRHLVDPAEWADGVNISAQVSTGCFQAINSHPAFDVHYANCLSTGDNSFNLRAIGGSLVNVKISLGANPLAQDALLHSTTLEPEFQYLWDAAEMVLDGLEVTDVAGNPYGNLRVSNGALLRVNAVTCSKLSTGRTLAHIRLGTGNRFGANDKPPKFGQGISGIRRPIQSDANPRVDAKLLGGEYVVDLYEQMVDQNTRVLRAYGTIYTRKPLAKDSIKIVTNAFGDFDNPGNVAGKITLTAYLTHSSAGAFDIKEKTYAFYQKITQASNVVFPVEAMLETTSQGGTAQADIIVSNPSQEGATQLGAEGKFNVSFDAEVTASGANAVNPFASLTYSLELVMVGE